MSKGKKPKEIGPSIEIEKVMVTPEMAVEWLKNNPINRPLRHRRISTIAGDILSGRWLMNGNTFTFTAAGKLINGQHRLNAIIKANVAVPAIVVRGVKESAINSVDSISPRSAAQVFSMNEIKNGAMSAAICRWIKIIEAGGVETFQASPAELREVYDEHPLIEKYAHAATQKSINKLMSSPPMAAMVLAAEKYGQDVVDTFLYQFSTGEDMKKGTAVYELREKFFQNVNSSAKFGPSAKVAMTLKALKAYKNNKPVSLLRWSPNEEWPTL